jgi:hypothetical protein
MTIIALTECCALLGIDPKTLRNWLKHANVPVAAHPTDARIKGLTLQDVHQLARLHARPQLAPASALACSEEQASRHPEREATHVQAPQLVPPCSPPEAELIQKLVGLERQVTTMQHQLAHLALELLHERELRYERRLEALEARVQQTTEHEASAPHAQTRAGTIKREAGVAREQRLHPTQRRTRPLLPLIEYGASGSYVIICPKLGDLSLVPDSPEWFAWLASVSSFRFVGKSGRFTACRVFHKGPTCYWQAYRSIHQHRYKPYLGKTESLTINCLEQAAATLQSYLERR